MKKILFAITIIFTCALAAQAKQVTYDAHGKRDPFVPLMGQDRPMGASKLSEVVTIDDLKLEGIVGSAGNLKAILNGEIVKEGSKSGEVAVKKIKKDSVSLTIGGKEYTLKLNPEEAKKE